MPGCCAVQYSIAQRSAAHLQLGQVLVLLLQGVRQRARTQLRRLVNRLPSAARHSVAWEGCTCQGLWLRAHCKHTVPALQLATRAAVARGRCAFSMLSLGAPVCAPAHLLAAQAAQRVAVQEPAGPWQQHRRQADRCRQRLILVVQGQVHPLCGEQRKQHSTEQM